MVGRSARRDKNVKKIKVMMIKKAGQKSIWRGNRTVNNQMEIKKMEK